MAKSNLLNTVAALGIPAAFLLIFMQFNSQSSPAPSTSSRTSTPESDQRLASPRGSKNSQSANQDPDSEAGRAASGRAALKTSAQNLPLDSARSSNAGSPKSHAALQERSSDEHSAQVSEPIAGLGGANGSANPEENLETELGREKAEYYRKVQELAFREYTEEDEKKEMLDLNTQLAMNAQQDQATGLVLENARTAYAQQQRTVQENAAKLPAKERLAAYEKLAQFRRQYILDRMKSILSPDQLAYYQSQLAEQQIAEDKALH